MIPVQDAVPSGRPPIATLTLIAVNAIFLVADIDADGIPAAAFTHATPLTFLTTMWFLWLFGDSVEARLGRITLVLLYIAGGTLAVSLPLRLGIGPAIQGLGVASAISAVIGAYFMLIPRSRVLMLVPAPLWLVEMPAGFFFGLWWLLQVMTFVLAPASVRLQTDSAAALYALGAAMVMGAAVCRVMRRPVRWC